MASVTSQIEWDSFLTMFGANNVGLKQPIPHWSDCGGIFSQTNLAQRDEKATL